MIVITVKKSGFKFHVRTEDQVYNAIYSIVGDELAENGIPLAQEVAGWADLATYGETYETDRFIAECVEFEKL